MTLEEQLFALLELHGLSSIQLHATNHDGMSYVYAIAHSQGQCCFSEGHRLQSANAALGSAIGLLNVKLRPPFAYVATLAPMEEPA